MYTYTLNITQTRALSSTAGAGKITVQLQELVLRDASGTLISVVDGSVTNPGGTNAADAYQGADALFDRDVTSCPIDGAGADDCSCDVAHKWVDSNFNSDGSAVGNSIVSFQTTTLVATYELIKADLGYKRQPASWRLQWDGSPNAVLHEVNGLVTVNNCETMAASPYSLVHPPSAPPYRRARHHRARHRQARRKTHRHKTHRKTRRKTHRRKTHLRCRAAATA